MRSYTIVFFCLFSLAGLLLHAQDADETLLTEAAAFMEKGKRAEDLDKLEEAKLQYQNAANTYEKLIHDKADSVYWVGNFHANIALGRIYQIQTQTDSALALGMKTLQKAKTLFGERHETLGKAYNLLGRIQDELQNYDEALDLHTRALEIREELYGSFHGEVAQSRHNLGNIALGKGEYLNSISYFRQALSIRQSLPSKQDKEIATAHVNLGICFTQLGNHDSAFFHFLQAEKSFKVSIPLDHHYFSFLYNNMANAYQGAGDYEKALAYNFMALQIKNNNFEEKPLNVASSYLNIGSVYFQKGDYFDAEKYLRKALDLLLEEPENKELLIGAIYHNLSSVIHKIGDRETAEAYQKKAIILEREILGEEHPEIAKQYNNLALLYIQKGNFSEARNYLLKTLDIQLGILPASHPSLGDTYGNLGVVEEGLENYSKADEYLAKAWDIYQENLGPKHPRIADMYLNRGVVALKLGMERQAVILIEKSLVLRKEIFGEDSPAVAQSYFNMAKVFADGGQYAKARLIYEKVQQIYQANFGPTHTDIGLCWMQLGLIALKEGNHLEAIEHLAQGLRAIGMRETLQEEEVFKGLLNELIALEILFSKALSEREYAEEDNAYLSKADQTLSLALSLLQYLRKSYQHEETELHLQKLVLPLFELAISSKLDLYEANGKEEFLEAAFSLMEQSKAYLLSRDLNLRQNSGRPIIPESISSKEEDLKLKHAFHLKELQQRLVEGENKEVQTLLKKVVRIEAERDSLAELIARDFPDYFAFKYEFPLVKLEEVQAYLSRHPQKLLLEFFWGESSCFIFAISEDKIDYRSFSIDSLLEKEVLQFIELNNKERYVRDERLFMLGKEKFAQLGQQLFQLLLDSSLNQFENKHELLLISDGLLGYLPFETLLTHKVEIKKSYKKFPFLLKKYSLSYEYSSSLLLYPYKYPKTKKLKYAGFAPLYSTNFLSNYQSRLGQSMDGENFQFSDLRYNRAEVDQIAEMMTGSRYIGPLATESSFKKEAPKFDILHLAMHGFTHEERPLESGLIFSPQTDSLNDGILHAHELYGMKLRAKLAILSACHTGSGKLARGEGIMSLSRAFKYAGCPNVISTLWQADDKSTQELIHSFFTSVAREENMATALRKAKLKFLEEANEIQAHPAHWAAFIYIGDPEALELKAKKTPIPLLLILVLFGLGFFYLVFFRKSFPHK